MLFFVFFLLWFSGLLCCVKEWLLCLEQQHDQVTINLFQNKMKVQHYFALTSQKAERIFSVCFSSDCGFCAMVVP